ncbi:MAG: hypothetical protein ACHQM6_00275 [Candidatus Kapaibacterium sp.]
MANEEFTYEPGVCNIDSAGVRWRKRLAYICLIAGAASLGVMYYIHFGMIFRFIVGAGFGYMTSLNFIQAKEHFCIMNASKRTFEISLHRTKIVDDLYKDLDLKKMRNVIGRSLVFAALGGCLGFLPL